MHKKRDARKYIIMVFCLFLLFAIPIAYNIYLKKVSLNVSKRIEQENLDDMCLTIYYLSPDALMYYPVSSVEDLIRRCDKKMVISGSDLEDHIDLFKQISTDDLQPVIRKSSDLDLRVYYVLESRKNGKLFDVAMWGDEQDSIFVNKVEVKQNNIFYDVIIPFLSEDEVEVLEDFK